MAFARSSDSQSVHNRQQPKEPRVLGSGAGGKWMQWRDGTTAGWPVRQRHDNRVFVARELVLQSGRAVRGRQPKLEVPDARWGNPAHRMLEAVTKQELVDVTTVRRSVFHKVELAKALQRVRGRTLGQAEVILELTH